jgi:rRNA maturation RNase YbeY
VITFDNSDNGTRPSGRFNEPDPVISNPPDSLSSQRLESRAPLLGEIFISIDDAVSQARQFRSTWESELVRYLVHGTLHLRGYDDLQPALRRTMKREENRLLKELSRRFNLGRLKKVTR